MTNSVTCMDGFTITVGDRVRFTSSGGSEGMAIVRGFNEKTDKVFLDPEPTAFKGSDCWALNPDAARKAGRPDYWAPRDNGVSFGHIVRPHWGYAPLPEAMR